jgi:nucleoside-diphosphate-sugar epimerase
MPGTVIASLLRNEPALCTHGEQIRDFMHVHDVADALVSLLDSSLHGPINIASGQPLAVRDLVTQIADRLGRRELLRLGAVPHAAGDPPRLLGDVERLSKELGWRPSLTLAEGLDQTLAWNQARATQAARKSA